MKKVVLIIVALLLIIANLWVIYNSELKPVGDSKENIDFIVEKGDTYTTIASKLKEADLIKSELAYKIYIKLNKINSLEAGKYSLNKSMSVKDIVDTLGKGSNYNTETIKITFKEGKNMRAIASIIEENTNNTVDNVMNTLKDEEYLDSLINEYWFITDEIKNKNIYYPLEGYLFPDTYEFLNKDVTVKTIFKTMLDNMNKKLEPYKEEIEKSEYSFHKLLTLASIVELEGASSNDRALVAGVFYNRLKSGWALGSDVTTYYAEKMDDWTNGLTFNELNKCNSYNTRSNCFTGLPVGPICNPGLESLKATFEPSIHNDYYFVADCNGKTYLSKDASTHSRTIKDLKNKGLWCEK